MNIGELSRLSGLTVKTIRYYSDVGLVPEADRTSANYRRYDHASLVRLEFVRTLRELGLDIATIRRVLDRSADLSSVAAAHAEAIGAQIRILKLRRAALRALARREPTPQEVERMNRIAQATADERRRIIDEFWDSVFTDVPANERSTRFQAGMRSVSADLPDDPTDEQVDAWIELAELVRDEGFRARLRAMGQQGLDAGRQTMPADVDVAPAAEAIESGISPEAPEADAVLAGIVGPWAAAVGREYDAAYRAELADQIQLGYEPRAQRYWQLLATINGWRPIPDALPQWAWLIDALRARS